jgi:spore germination cell wall hydrolase CwlJ-like protein
MNTLLRRLSGPEHRLWIAAALLALVATGVSSSLPAGSRPAVPGSRQPGMVQRPAYAELLALTQYSRTAISEADAARQANLGLPLLANALQTARPFALPAGIDLPGADRARQCLALAMYYEAAFEGPAGRKAVAQVVLNRVRHPAFPHDVCSVVFQRTPSNICQFTFACDGAMLRSRLPALWQQTLAEAQAALRGTVYAGVGMATHYHADYVFPVWAPRLEKIAAIGTHLFYRWPDGWGLRRAFSAAHDGSEPALAGLERPVEASPPIPIPADLAALAGEVAPYRGDNAGGFVDPSLGWIPNIARTVPVVGTPRTGPGHASPELAAPQAP